MTMFEKDSTPTVSMLMNIADVSERTARRWLSGESPPPSAVVRLATLEMNGRIIPDSWPSWWHFNKLDKFETETCHEALSWQQLTWFNYVILSWHESLRLIPEIEGTINYLMDKLPKAEVIEMEAYREKLRELIAKSYIKPSDLQLDHNTHDKENHRASGC
jgi:hypothetical protein